MRPYTSTKISIRPYIRNTLLMINDELPWLYLHVNYLSQLQCNNRHRLHDFDVLTQKRLTRGARAVCVAEIEAAYAEDVIRVHVGALIDTRMICLRSGFASKHILMVILLSSVPIAPLYR